MHDRDNIETCLDKIKELLDKLPSKFGRIVTYPYDLSKCELRIIAWC